MPASSALPTPHISGVLCRRFYAPAVRIIVGRHKVDMADAECAREMEQGHDGRVAPALFETADILLREAGNLGEALLGEALLPAEPPEIATHQLAHIHARKLRLYTL